MDARASVLHNGTSMKPWRLGPPRTGSRIGRGGRRSPLGLVAVCVGLTLLSVGRVAPAAEGKGPPIYRMVFPLLGEHTLTDSFGDARGGGRSHAGIDIMAERMVPVVAVADGTVSWIHDERGNNCCDVALLHDDGWRSRYIHLNNDTPGTDDGRAVGIAPGISRGARVAAGQLIGWVGDSGNAESTAPHLHFELRRPDGSPINALPSLRAALRRGRELGGGVSRPGDRAPGRSSEPPLPQADAGSPEPKAETRGGLWRRLLGEDDDTDVAPAPPMPADEGEPKEPVEEEEAVQVPRPPLDEAIARSDYADGAYPDLGMDRRVEEVAVEGEGSKGGAAAAEAGSGGGLLGCFGFSDKRKAAGSEAEPTNSTSEP